MGPSVLSDLLSGLLVTFKRLPGVKIVLSISQTPVISQSAQFYEARFTERSLSRQWMVQCVQYATEVGKIYIL